MVVNTANVIDMNNTPNHTHRLATFDPSTLTLVTDFYQGASEEVAMDYQAENLMVEGLTYSEGNYSRAYTCDLCGVAFSYGVVFVDLNGEHMAVGHTCASKYLDLPNSAAVKRARVVAKVKATKEREEVKAKAQDFLAGFPGLGELLNDLPDDAHYILIDLCHKLNRYGDLSEKQVALAFKLRDQAIEQAKRKAEWQAAKEAGDKLEAGKQTLTGTIVSTKWKENQYGGSLKMLVQLDSGSKVWGTCPAKVDSRFAEGTTITFSATVEVSDDDEYFGFFKRPTKIVWEGPELIRCNQCGHKTGKGELCNYCNADPEDTYDYS